jgi:hypothetical protein
VKSGHSRRHFVLVPEDANGQKLEKRSDDADVAEKDRESGVDR